MLLQDFRKKQDELEQLENKLMQLKQKHKDIVKSSKASSSCSRKKKSNKKYNSNPNLENSLTAYISKVTSEEKEYFTNRSNTIDDQDDDDGKEIPADIQKLAADFLRLR